MKKKHKAHRHSKKGYRNNGGGGSGVSPPARSRSRLPRRATPPGWKTIVAALAGGAGGAALSGLLVNQKVLSSEASGLGLMLGGGATAYFADGHARVVGTSMAAAGAGQLALAIMNKRAVAALDKEERDKTKEPIAPPPPVQTAQLPAAPPPVVAPPRKSATGGGVVVDLFRDAANDLDLIEDEWRYGIRDHAAPGADTSELIVIDLDEAA
jgi:prepilin-type processing-associated H-X9-DG protein